MIKIQFLFILLLFIQSGTGQTNTYSISFGNAEHHEGAVSATFSDIEEDTLALRMSRSSPGRYALHEFAKNVYNFMATDEQGKPLEIVRPDPYQWHIVGHRGTVKIQYILYANRGDGTYSQIDETHAHLNIPATFMFAPSLSKRKVEVTFELPENRNWKVATQLLRVEGNTYTAPDLQYFMDSPTEISDFGWRSFEAESKRKTFKIQLALHHNGSEVELDRYFEKVKKVVAEEKDIFGELPDFDFGNYTFLACYISNATGDGMEHRNSTVLTSTRSLDEGGMEGNISTVSHEFFHAWNVERIRPASLEPFDFTKANMSGELWFAEGFTSYFTDLVLCRAGLISPGQYIEGLTGTFNYVWNSPARQFFNPIEMSYQAPFVDAATAVDPVNRENTFISYYSYGSVLGLALDLSLRQNGLSLDGYMKLVWNRYGKSGIPYTISDLHQSLNQYAGTEFGDTFFNNYIYESNMPDYKSLFDTVGVDLTRDPEVPYFGGQVTVQDDGTALVGGNTVLGSPAYSAGLDIGDTLIALNGKAFDKHVRFPELIAGYAVGDTLEIKYRRYGNVRTTRLMLGSNPAFRIGLQENNGSSPTPEALMKRADWLKTK
ncbi:MAG TPA: PDZ domain-containing protein [Eudoraea sp.]|nr:PDZ domain-containing protein [Eudoraea sp.]